MQSSSEDFSNHSDKNNGANVATEMGCNRWKTTHLLCCHRGYFDVFFRYFCVGFYGARILRTDHTEFVAIFGQLKLQCQGHKGGEGTGNHNTESWNGAEAQGLNRCGNEPDDNELQSTTKVTNAFRIRTSDLFGVTNSRST